MRESFTASLQAAQSQLQRIDRLPIPSWRSEIRMFMIVRNESLRLPFVLDYYLCRGVDRLFVVENNSTDNTLEILLAEERAPLHLFRTAESYAGHWHWMEYLLEEFGRGHWCLVVDADELLVYPQGEDLSLRDLTDFLAAEGTTALYSFLLDLYPEVSCDRLRYRPGEDPLEIPLYFDPDSHQEVTGWIVSPKSGESFPYRAFRGGVRRRLFGISTALTKIPLLRFSDSTYLIQGMHAAEGVSLSPVEGAVLHIKYLQDFVGRVLDEAQRGQHWNDAEEYRGMAAHLEQGRSPRLHDRRSVRFTGPPQLIELGLMRETAALLDFACRRRAARAGALIERTAEGGPPIS
ncbi:MAG TPA: glycosyltransferase family 2 protein [Thermoanaerobaculia bacterium]|nr:glycosyltransferase family 2 protein [Thermoanaerobaculia bacterium]